MNLRTGRKVGRTLYVQVGDEPSDGDRLVGLVDTPELAALIVGAVNRQGGVGSRFVQEEPYPPVGTDA